MAVSINHLTSNVTLQVTQPYLVVDGEGLKAFAVGIQGPTGATTNLGGLTDVDDAAVPTNRYFVVGDNTKFVTRGIVGDDLPSGIDAAKLANGLVSNTEFQYLDGVSSSIQTQIDGKAATSHVHSGADITSGTLPVARLNGGNSTQFLRGDGTYSNTLTGGLTIAGALAGATTGTFSGTVSTGTQTVAGNIQFSATPSRVCGPAGNAGQIVLAGGSGADWTTGGIFRAWGNSSAQTGNVQMIPGSAAGALVEIYDRALTRQAFVDVNGFNVNKIIYGAAGTTTAANNETVGSPGGLRYNVASGLAHTFLIANGIAGIISAGHTAIGSLAGSSISTGTGNTCIGVQAGMLIAGASSNTCIGSSAGAALVSGSSNIAIGAYAMSGGTGSTNVAIGNACLAGVTGSNNIGIGGPALSSMVGGSGNIGLGVNSALHNVSGSSNVVIGTNAAIGVAASSNFSDCIVIGASAGSALLSAGTGNTIIGQACGANITSGADNIMIGRAVSAQSATGSNQINIGNTFQKTSAGVVSVDAPSGGSVIATVNATTIATFSATDLNTTAIGRRVKTSTKTTTYTATASDYILIGNHATTPFTITLPAATGTGQVLFIKNIGAANVTVDANASETIDGALTQVLTTGNRIQIVDYATGLWAAI